MNDNDYVIQYQALFRVPEAVLTASPVDWLFSTIPQPAEEEDPYDPGYMAGISLQDVILPPLVPWLAEATRTLPPADPEEEDDPAQIGWLTSVLDASLHGQPDFTLPPFVTWMQNLEMPPDVIEDDYTYPQSVEQVTPIVPPPEFDVTCIDQQPIRRVHEADVVYQRMHRDDQRDTP